MSIITVILILAIFAAAFYLIWRFVPPGALRTVLLVAIGIILVVWLLNVTGLLGSIQHERV